MVTSHPIYDPLGLGGAHRPYPQYEGNIHNTYTAVALRKTWLLHKQIKNRAILAYKNSVRKCYQGSFFYCKYAV